MIISEIYIHASENYVVEGFKFTLKCAFNEKPIKNVLVLLHMR